MAFSLFLPLIYLIVGLLLGKVPADIKGWMSRFLTRIIIPIVIIYNISTYQPGVFSIMLGMIIMMIIMVILSKIFTKDPIVTLCFCYLNIGWLALPIVSSLFGDEAAMVIIAAYVGSSLFGNSVGVGLIATGENLSVRLRRTFSSPPVIALIVGLLLIPFSTEIQAHIKPVYAVIKVLMSFMGMAILGIWLSSTRLRLHDFKQAVYLFFYKLVTVGVLVSIFIYLCGLYDVRLVTQNQLSLYLMALLPPAANIIVLETHYVKTGRSASMIAAGTIVSIVAIVLYIATLFVFMPEAVHR